jgi:hypothetical protein
MDISIVFPASVCQSVVNDAVLQNGTTSLVLASSHDHDNVEVVRILLEAGADVHAKDEVSQDVWSLPCCEKRMECVQIDRVALGSNEVFMQNDDTSLTWACSLGHVEVVKVLLEAKADVHAVNKVSLYSTLPLTFVEHFSTCTLPYKYWYTEWQHSVGPGQS